jgi:hypothetical protein
MSDKLTRFICAAGLLAGIGAGFATASRPAEAQRLWDQPYEEWQSESKRPRRGYEGFPAPGVYCSYRREPNRECTTDKRGRRTCRIKSWTLVQSCS